MKVALPVRIQRQQPESVAARLHFRLSRGALVRLVVHAACEDHAPSRT